jgi:uncharacterized membrane protein
MSVLLLVIAVSSRPLFVGGQRLWLAGLWFLGCIAVMAPTYLTYTPVGHAEILGVQGRYFIPLAMMLGMVVAWRKPNFAWIRETRMRLLLALGMPLAIDGYLIFTRLL